jgi:hypothetical protein
MDLDKQLRLGHLLLNDRRCRSCGEVKNLIGDFYRTRKDRGAVPSSYSYECKSCSIKRITKKRKYQQNHQYKKEHKRTDLDWYYPDW